MADKTCNESVNIFDKSVDYQAFTPPQIKQEFEINRIETNNNRTRGFQSKQSFQGTCYTAKENEPMAREQESSTRLDRKKPV